MVGGGGPSGFLVVAIFPGIGILFALVPSGGQVLMGPPCGCVVDMVVVEVLVIVLGGDDGAGIVSFLILVVEVVMVMVMVAVMLEEVLMVLVMVIKMLVGVLELVMVKVLVVVVEVLVLVAVVEMVVVLVVLVAGRDPRCSPRGG